MTLKVVHIQWRDSEGENSWTPLEDISDELELTHSVGILVKETESFLLLALSFDPATDSIHCHKKIPRSCVEKMRTICRIKMTKTK